MKNIIVFLFLGSFLFVSCNSEDSIYNKETDNSNVISTINRVENKTTSKTTVQQNKQKLSLQELINQIEADAMQDSGFTALVDENYRTPLAADIEAILQDPVTALLNLSIKTSVKNYVGNILNTNTTTDLLVLNQTIQNDILITEAEKNMLTDVINLQSKHTQNYDGNDDDWNTRKIISYVQGYTISRANAVLNVLIIKVIEKEN